MELLVYISEYLSDFLLECIVGLEDLFSEVLLVLLLLLKSVL